MIWELVITTVTGIVGYMIVNYIIQILNLSKYPAGPIPIPVLGNLHLISSTKPFESLRDLSKKYGDVFSISFGSQRVVIVNTIENAKEALCQRGTDFAGRPSDIYTMNFLTRNGKDIAVCDYGERWRTLRKLAHQSLKVYGPQMESFESLVNLEIDHLAARLDKKHGQAFNPFHNVSNAVINIICAIVFGSRYDVDDPEFLQVVKYIYLIIQGLGNSDALAFMPWLRFFPSKSLSQLQEGLLIRDPILQRNLEHHRKTLDGENLRDFTDAILKVAMEEEAENSRLKQYFNDDHLTMVLNDVFTAGGDTTVTTIMWALVYLIHWPSVQKKAKEELKFVIGNKTKPSLNQRKQLHYIDAIIHETLRKSSLVPLGVPHKAVRDSQINKKSVPQNTQVLFNIWAIHHDSRHWEDPEKFLPERWLDENDHFDLSKGTSYMPFSAGRRVCLGESLAKAELFLLISFLIHNYDICHSELDGLPELDGISSLTYSPKPYKVVLKKVYHN